MENEPGAGKANQENQINIQSEPFNLARQATRQNNSAEQLFVLEIVLRKKNRESSIGKGNR